MTDEQQPDEVIWDRLAAVIRYAIDGLSERERQERIEWCQLHDMHGVRADFADPEVITLTWAGSRLAVVDRAVLLDGEPCIPVYVRDDIGDGVPDEWLGDD